MARDADTSHQLPLCVFPETLTDREMLRVSHEARGFPG